MKPTIAQSMIAMCATWCAYGQAPEIRPQALDRTMRDGQVTTIYVAPRFATAVRLPEAVNSVVLGDPEAFSAEHSEREPQIVVLKPTTTKPAQTNVLISTVRGLHVNLLLISRGEPQLNAPAAIDLLVRYRPAGRFLVEPGPPSISVPQITPVASNHSDPERPRTVEERARSSGSDSLDLLLQRQRKAPLPVLYGERPGIPGPGAEILNAGVSEVIDEGRTVVVLFSVVNRQNHAVELMPPQVQLGGKVTKGKLVRRKVWSSSEQLPVIEYRLSRRRIGAGERSDGVLVFERPSFKQSNETLLLQVADSGAVDRPALAPIGFGISTYRKTSEE